MKNERKRKNPALVMTIGALAAVGAASIVRGAKTLLHNMSCRMKGIVHSDDDCK